MLVPSLSTKLQRLVEWKTRLFAASGLWLSPPEDTYLSFSSTHECFQNVDLEFLLWSLPGPERFGTLLLERKYFIIIIITYSQISPHGREIMVPEPNAYSTEREKIQVAEGETLLLPRVWVVAMKNKMLQCLHHRLKYNFPLISQTPLWAAISIILANLSNGSCSAFYTFGSRFVVKWMSKTCSSTAATILREEVGYTQGYL